MGPNEVTLKNLVVKYTSPMDAMGKVHGSPSFDRADLVTPGYMIGRIMAIKEDGAGDLWMDGLHGFGSNGS